jgi:hypothetical protein
MLPYLKGIPDIKDRYTPSKTEYGVLSLDGG